MVCVQLSDPQRRWSVQQAWKEQIAFAGEGRYVLLLYPENSCAGTGVRIFDPADQLRCLTDVWISDGWVTGAWVLGDRLYLQMMPYEDNLEALYCYDLG